MILTKRQKFIASSLLLSVGLLAIQWVSIEFRYVAVFGFFLASYLVSAFALFDDLKGVEWLTILALPALYSAAVALFYFLLPESVLSRIIILTLFGLGMYALYLTENIFSVAAIRTIQLVRAAHAVGFLMSLLTLILYYNTIFSLKWPFWANGLLVFAVSFPIVLQALWSIPLPDKLTRTLWVSSLGTSLVLGQLAVVLSFLPATVWISSLFLATVVYVALGLLQHALSGRLFDRTLREYVGVGLVVLLATLLVTPWK